MFSSPLHGRAMAIHLAPVMFGLSLVFLVGVAGMMVCLVDVPRLSEAIHVAAAERRGATEVSELADPTYRQWVFPAQRLGGWVFLGLGFLWPLFWIESLATLWLAPRARVTWGQWVMTGAIAVFPPLRMARHHPCVRGRVWLPRMHWRRAGKRMQRELERVFSGPMILIALLILPVLIVEWTLNDRIASYPWLRVVLHLSTGGIWLAFVCEFVVMISVAPRRLQYCKKHWLDLAIILLPLISFLRTLRLLRASKLAQVQKVTKIIRVYRLRGVSMRFFRALLVLEVLQRLFASSPEKRLARLYDQLQIKEEEVEDLRREIAALEAVKALNEQKKRDEVQNDCERQSSAAAERAELVMEARALTDSDDPTRAS